MSIDARAGSGFCVLGLALGLLIPQGAAASEAVRVVFRVATADDLALLTRLRGQLSDVNAQLIALEEGPLEASFDQQLSAAHVLAERHAVSAVLWFTGAEAQAQLTLHLATRDERVLSRPIGSSRDGRMSSSSLELAAMVARGALAALAARGGDAAPAREPDQASHDEGPQTPDARPLENEPIALAPVEPPQQVTADRRSSEASAPQPPRPQPAPRLPEPEAPARLMATPHSVPEQRDTPEELRTNGGGREHSVDARLFLGAQAAVDGVASAGQWGVCARAALGLSDFSLSVYGAASLGSSVDDPYFHLSIARHALGLSFAVRTQPSAALELTAGLHGGAALFRRTSSAKSALAVGYPSSLTAAFVVGPDVTLAWLFGRYGVGLGLALDVLPRAPRFDSVGPSPLGGTLSHPLWALQPRLSLGVEVVLP